MIETFISDPEEPVCEEEEAGGQELPKDEEQPTRMSSTRTSDDDDDFCSEVFVLAKSRCNLFVFVSLRWGGLLRPCWGRGGWRWSSTEHQSPSEPKEPGSSDTKSKVQIRCGVTSQRFGSNRTTLMDEFLSCRGRSVKMKCSRSDPLNLRVGLLKDSHSNVLKRSGKSPTEPWNDPSGCLEETLTAPTRVGE